MKIKCCIWLDIRTKLKVVPARDEPNRSIYFEVGVFRMIFILNEIKLKNIGSTGHE